MLRLHKFIILIRAVVDVGEHISVMNNLGMNVFVSIRELNSEFLFSNIIMTENESKYRKRSEKF